MNPLYLIETERLALRKMTAEDATFLYRLNLDPEVVKYTGDPPFKSVEAAAEFLREYNYEATGMGRWAVCLQGSDTPIGWCGLKVNEQNEIDLGFRFFKSEWGKGYATESAKACLKYGFDALKLKRIVGRAMPENKASIRILEKIGMTYKRTTDCNGLHNAAYFELTQKDYETSHA